MRATFLLILTIAGLHGFPSTLWAQSVKDREGAVRSDRAAHESDPRWIYNSVAQGLAEAQKTGKPLLVALRCVPCLACSAIDAQVLLKQSELSSLLDQFVCVRVINANALDLSIFQFDYDLSFSLIFLNADKTVYGRFGSWTHQKNAQEAATAGLKRALESALELHHGYPANRDSLRQKQALPLPYATPVDIPELSGKYSLELNWDKKVVPSCIHCHQIGDAMRLGFRKRKEQIPIEWIYPMPPTDVLGCELESDQIARIRKVTKGSPAAAAGLRISDDIVAINDQPILSIADVRWALHHAPEEGSLNLKIRRSDQVSSLTLALPAGWRARTDISDRVGTWELRGMALGGMKLQEIPTEEKQKLKIPPTQMALRAEHVGEYGIHAAAKKAGFQKEDILISVDGHNDHVTESELIGQLIRSHQAGTRVSVSVRREDQVLELQLPQQ